MVLWQPGMIITSSRINPEGWEDFTPTVYTNMSTTPTPVSSTRHYARWRREGSTVWAVASVAVNETTSGGVGISLPVPAARRFFNIGSLVLMGLGTLPTDQSGVAFMLPTFLDRIVLVAYSTGNRDVGAAGQTLRYSVCYEAAV